MDNVLSGANGKTPFISPGSGACLNARRRLWMLTIGHAQKYVSRAIILAYASVILTRASGPGGMARSQAGDGRRGDCATAGAPRLAVASRTKHPKLDIPEFIVCSLTS